MECLLKFTDGLYLNFVFPILILYNINMNGCTRLAFFISLPWRADESYLGRNSRNFLKSMKLIILLSFSGKFGMHLSWNFCSWRNDQQPSVSVYIFSKLVLLWILLTQCGRAVMINQTFSATRWKCLHEKIGLL